MPLNPYASRGSGPAAALMLLTLLGADAGAERPGLRAMPANAASAPRPQADGTPPALLADLRRAYSGPPETWPAAAIDPGRTIRELAAAPPPPAPGPEAALGARLFSDPGLSVDGRVACADCHDPAQGFTVGRKVGLGVGGQPGRRNPPALFSVARRTHLDWDGRGTELERDIDALSSREPVSTSLEHALAARVLVPLADAREMGPADMRALCGKLARGTYGAAFAALYGAEGASPRTLAAALVAYLETLDIQSRFDSFLRGDRSALTGTELHGLHLFRTKARCMNCHFGPLLTDEGFHNLGLSFFGEPAQDLGRYDVTGRAEDAGRFRTPSLRHVAATAPYMHNGLFPTLEGVVNLYNRGGGEVWARNAAEAARPLHQDAARRSPHIRPLGLSPEEKAALVAFLRTL